MSFFQKFIDFIEGNNCTSKAVKNLLKRGFTPDILNEGGFPEIPTYSKTLKKTGTRIDYVVDKKGRINRKIITLGEGNHASANVHSVQANYDLCGNINMATVNSKSPIYKDPRVLGMSLKYTKKGNTFRKNPMAIIPVYYSFL